jgi:hypothetical protein
MSITRESIIRGPGTVTHNGVQIFDKDGIDAALVPTDFDVPVSLYGNVDTRRADLIGQISATPCGIANSGLLAALFPYGNPTIGASLGTGTDLPLLVKTLAGKKLTFTAAFLSRMPTLRLSARETLFGGAAEWIAIIGNNITRTTNNSMWTVADEAWSGSFDKAQLICKPTAAAWGSTAPWDAIKTESGWTIDFELGMEPVTEDTEGTVDYILTSVGVMAKCRPLGLTESHVLTAMRAQNTGNAIGASIRTGDDLVLAATGGLTVTIKDAALVEGPLRFGTTDLRVGELGFRAHRSISSGTPGAIFTVAMTE